MMGRDWDSVARPWRHRLLTGLVLMVVVVGIWYLRYIDFPSFDGETQLREIAEYRHEARSVHYFRSRNFMDTWHLLRAEIAPEQIEHYVPDLGLEQRGEVEHFDLIISRPPPYWWHPERLPRAVLYEGSVPDGRSLTLRYAEESSTAYFLVY